MSCFSKPDEDMPDPDAITALFRSALGFPGPLRVVVLDVGSLPLYVIRTAGSASECCFVLLANIASSIIDTLLTVVARRGGDASADDVAWCAATARLLFEDAVSSLPPLSGEDVVGGTKAHIVCDDAPDGLDSLTVYDVNLMVGHYTWQAYMKEYGKPGQSLPPLLRLHRSLTVALFVKCALRGLF